MRSSEVAPEPVAPRGPWLERDDERALLVAAQAGDRAAMERLCASNLRLVARIAGEYRRPWVQMDDLIGEGAVGLVEAIRRFDLTQDTRLGTYAAWWIRAKVREFEYESRGPVSLPTTRGVRIARAGLVNAQRELTRQLQRTPTRAEAASALGIEEADVACVAAGAYARASLQSDASSQGGFEPADVAPDPEEATAARELEALYKARMASSLAALRERDRQILDAHFSEDEVSLAELGSSLGITRQRVSQIVHRLRKTLARDLRDMAC